MTGLPALRRRIRSVSNTRQITRAMQLVAATRLRHAEEAVPRPAAYAELLATAVAELAAWPELTAHPYLVQAEPRQTLLIIIAGDRGLAGAYNSNVLNAAAAQIYQGPGAFKAICVGKRAEAAVAHLSNLEQLAAYDLESGQPDIQLARPIAREAAQGVLEGQFQAVRLVFTRFITAVKQEVVNQPLLPLSPSPAPPRPSAAEPEPRTVAEQAVLRYLEAVIYQALVQAAASEQAARMLAMMNATENAGNLISDLTLAMNQERQDAITQELAEISAGVEAMQGDEL